MMVVDYAFFQQNNGKPTSFFFFFSVLKNLETETELFTKDAEP